MDFRGSIGDENRVFEQFLVREPDFILFLEPPICFMYR